MTEQIQAIKGSFEWQGRTFTAWTNGKVYGGGTRYVTTNSPTGSQAKITYSLEKGISVGGAHGLDFARAALRGLGFDE
jgi:hypothetical protein